MFKFFATVVKLVKEKRVRSLIVISIRSRKLCVLVVIRNMWNLFFKWKPLNSIVSGTELSTTSRNSEQNTGLAKSLLVFRISQNFLNSLKVFSISWKLQISPEISGYLWKLLKVSVN